MAAREGEASATIAVPADYLEDVRSAVVVEIHDDSDMLQHNQAEMREKDGWGREDRDAAVRLVRRNLCVLDQLLNATKDTELLADSDTLFNILQRMCRQMTDRLKDEMHYEPVDMLKTITLAERMEWAAKQAVALNPRLAVA